MSLTPVIIVYIFSLHDALPIYGLNVAVLPSGLRDTVPVTALLLLSFRVKVVLETVELCTASLNVAVMGELTVTPVAPLAGLVLATVGGVVSGAVVVVNVNSLVVII